MLVDPACIPSSERTMTTSTAFTDLTTSLPFPLPRIKGPKLEPFRGTADVELEFIRYIGNEDDLDSKVWKVKVDDKYYALKVFPFQYWVGLKKTSGRWIIAPEYDDEGRPPLTPQDYLDYLDPFHNECRVYGRLKQENHEDIAVRAHGYVLLTPEQEKFVTEACGPEYIDPKTAEELDGQALWFRRESNRHDRLRAILKDFVPEETPDFDKSQISQMYEDMETLHSLGILIRDINPKNYLGGKLIDFSRSWTMYHPCLDRTSWKGLCKLRIAEVRSFVDMVFNWAVHHETKITVPEKLLEWGGDLEGCGINPYDYDWRKWEEEEEEEAICDEHNERPS
ncbi:hypothetical protein KVR01_004535 [Diaporthe batatas]|uniref:uncharacterized protein n=1 Tax=Diaporthe batatas TaxID=748121 RepID=UPI001D04D689|nr:uncharacterized protein KVR01_004535 [Diaporthe batatas]KAG8165983.1 hypothetical protein KVR01_004535 [Diaporthe batatas]